MGLQRPDPGGVRQPLPEPLVLRKVYEGSSTRPMAGWATLNYDPRTNYAWYGSLHLNNRFLTGPATRRKTACHELGHVFGLGHRSGGRTCMRDGVLAADAVWDEIELPDPAEVGWRTAATRLAHGLYGMVTRHPWLLTAMSTHLLYGPGKARVDDHCLGVYEAAGFTGMDADNAYKTVFTFVLGTALGEAAEVAWRARLRRAGGNAEEQAQAAIAEALQVAMQFPRLRARGQAWQDADRAAAGEQSFEYGLQAILDGLQAQLAARPVPANPGAPSPA